MLIFLIHIVRIQHSPWMRMLYFCCCDGSRRHPQEHATYRARKKKSSDVWSKLAKERESESERLRVSSWSATVQLACCSSCSCSCSAVCLCLHCAFFGLFAKLVRSAVRSCSRGASVFPRPPHPRLHPIQLPPLHVHHHHRQSFLSSGSASFLFTHLRIHGSAPLCCPLCCSPLICTTYFRLTLPLSPHTPSIHHAARQEEGG